MGSVEKRVRDGKITWLARWRTPDGRQHKTSHTRKVDAARALAAIEADLLNSSYVDPARGRLTVGEWAEVWLAGRAHLKPKTLSSYRSLLRTRVLPTWEHVPLGSVTHGQVVAWLTGMQAAGLSPSRTRQSYHVLTSMLDAAVRDGRLARNPAAGVDLPRLPQTERRYLTHDQLADLADGCGPYRTLVLLLGYTGIRWGEVAALKVKRIDLSRGRIEIAESVVEVDGVQVWGPPKTHARRTVVVPRLLRDALAEQVAGKGPDDLLFPSRAGTPLRVGNFRRDHFDRAAAAAGLDGLVPHELRHTAASLAVAAGASIKGVQSMLGHASAAMTLDRYGHLLGDELDAVAERLDAAARARVPRTRPEDTNTPVT